MVPPIRIGRAEHGGAGHEGVGPGPGDVGDVVDLDAAIDLQPDLAAAACPLGIDAAPGLAQLVERGRDERLTTKTRVDRHQQHDVDLVQGVIQPGEQRGRVEHQPRLAALRPDELQRAVHMLAGLGVEGDEIGPCIGKGGRQIVDRRDHQMHVDGHADVLTQRLAHHRPHGEVGHIVVVHHVEMQNVRAGGLDGLHFLFQPAEVCRQHAGCDPESHVCALPHGIS